MVDDVALFAPGSPEYDRATKPFNSVGAQRPAVVARPDNAAAAVAAVRVAAGRGLVVRPQATGHGGGAEVGQDTLLLDTSGLDSVRIDAERRVAVVGAGAQWGAINAAAWPSGLLGLSGSSPDVAVCGYAFGGGLGWLTRSHGMASAALRRVNYVDGHGQPRTAADDAHDPIDREAMWAFRGGGGVGVATELEMDLAAVSDLYAGYLLFPVDQLPRVVAAWAQETPAAPATVSTSISVLHVPPIPAFPQELQGTVVVHLAVASSAGEGPAAPLLQAVRGAGAAAVDTWGPADAGKLGGIHLDPKEAGPALGTARWLSDEATGMAEAALGIAAPPDSPVAMLEIRHVGPAPAPRVGAETSPPGDFVVHAVAPLLKPDTLAAAEPTFQRLLDVVAPVDVGRRVGSWMEGAASVPDAWPADVTARVAAAADAVDPVHVLVRSRYLV